MYYINGQYVKEEDAKISILDLAILRGFGVFDYLRTYGGRPFHLRDHLLRLQYSTEHIGLKTPNSLDEIEEIIHTVLQLSNLSEAGIKILVTGGISTDQFTPHDCSNLIVFTYPLAPCPTHFWTDGIKVITTHLSRSVPTSKTTQYTSAIVALQRGKNQNAQEALYVNAHNDILEATTSNFFAFKQDILYTCCSEEVLLGITQDIIMKLATPHFPIVTRALNYSEILDMEEAFITSSNKEVMPVVQIDSFTIGNGQVGKKTQQIMALFRTYTDSQVWPQLNIPRYHNSASPAFAGTT